MWWEKPFKPISKDMKKLIQLKLNVTSIKWAKHFLDILK